MHDTADVIRRDTVTHFWVTGGPNFTRMSKNQVRNLVYNARRGGLVVMLFQRLSVNILDLSKLVFSDTVLLLLMRRGCSVWCVFLTPQLLALRKLT
jgi:hypothetical protein